MSIKITTSDCGKYLIGKIDEPLTADVARQLTTEYIKHLKGRSIKRILSDFRGSPNVMSTLQGYNFSYSEVGGLGLPNSIRVAVVIDVGDTTHDFQETLAQNAGYSVQLFHSFDHAVEWLLDETR